MKSLEGANCGDLPPFVVDKYFDCNVGWEPFRASVAKAICSNCTVIDDCLDEALTMPRLPPRGVIAGLAVTEIKRARSWQLYELGQSDQIPNSKRPEWLTLSDAAQTVEQYRVETDPDLPPPEV